MVCATEMLPGRQGSKIGYDELSQYIEGWLHYKENKKKYERFWFVLRGNIPNGRDLVTAYLFCFKDLNIHVEENAVGSHEIHSHDKVEFLKCAGNKPMKCDFTILLSETKFHFRADDEISRERWLYALCELIGKNLPPSELPTERNQIRTSFTSPHKKSSIKKVGPFHRSKTVELPTLLRGNGRPRDARSQSVAPGAMRSLSEFTAPSITDSPPLVPPPRSCASLPFMLPPSATDLKKDIPWFYPGMRREEAQERLQKCPAGYYLLRDSESHSGSYTLAFKDIDRIKNHMISKSADGQYVFIKSEVESSFPSPQKAVEFYMIKKHSKTLTPIPYVEKKHALVEDTDRDYLLPSEMNLTSSTTTVPPVETSQAPTASGYTHRELPPTPPTDVHALRNLSVTDVNAFRNLSVTEENDDEGYLEMEGNGVIDEPSHVLHGVAEEPSHVHVIHGAVAEPSHVLPLPFTRQFRLDFDDDHEVVERREMNERYVREPALRYGKEIAFDDNESYLTIANPEGMATCINGENFVQDFEVACRNGGDDSVSRESDSASGDDDHDYFEYEKRESKSATLKRQNEIEENGDVFEETTPSLPAKPESFKKGFSFSHYDDVSLRSYENQCVVDGVAMDAPPIPPRSSKPEAPGRSDSTYVNTHPT